MKPFKVCVVDDCEEAASVLCEGLRLNEYEAVMATSGKQALALCADGAVDLILLDVCMPEIDGFEVCRRLKQNDRTKDIPVIFVTARGDEDSTALGFELGATDYITKPFNLPMVMVRVDAALQTCPRAKECDGLFEFLSDGVYTDPLTGLRNRAYLMHRLAEEMEKSQRYDHPLSCVVFDIDDVQPIDDDAEPISAEDLLTELAVAVRNSSRAYDVVARFDGTVIAVLLPYCPQSDAVAYGAKMIREVEAGVFDPAVPVHARLSVGVATRQNGCRGTADDILALAMRSLLQAKSRGMEQRLVALTMEAAGAA